MSEQLSAEPPPDWDARLQAVEQAADDEARWAALLAAAGEAGHDADRAADLARAAQTHDLLDRWQQAAEALAAAEDSAPAWIRLAMAQWCGGQPGLAHDSLGMAGAHLPGDANILHLAPLAALAAGRWQQALDDLGRVGAGTAPGTADAQDTAFFALLRAAALGRLGRDEDASAVLATDAVTGYQGPMPSTVLAEAWLGWVRRLIEDGKPAAALAAVDASAHWNVAPPLRGPLLGQRLSALIQLGRYAEMMAPAREFAELVAAVPDDAAYAQFFLALAHEAQREPEAALAAAEAALTSIAQNANRGLMHLVAARALVHLKRPEEALAQLAQVDHAAVEAEVRGECELVAARALSDLGRHDEALAAAQRAQAAGVFELRRAELHWLMALAESRLGHPEAALPHFDAVLALPAPGLHEASHFGRGNALVALRRFEEAEAAFAAAAAAAATPPDRAHALQHTAWAAEAAGRADAAREAAEAAIEALQAQPDTASQSGTLAAAHLLLARLQQPADPAAAAAHLEAALAAQPALATNVGVQRRRWEAQLVQGRFTEAQAVVSEALLQPDLANHPLLHFMRCETDRRSGVPDWLNRVPPQALEVPEPLREDATAWFGAMSLRMANVQLPAAQAAREQLLRLEPTAANVPVVELIGLVARVHADDATLTEQDLATLDRLQAQPGEMPAMLMLTRGLVLQKLGRWAEAEAAFAEVSRVANRSRAVDVTFLVQSGVLRFSALAKLARHEQARGVLAATCELDSGAFAPAEVFQAFANILLAAILAEDGEHESALQRSTAALAGVDKVLGQLQSPPALLADLRRQAVLMQTRALLQLQRHEQAQAGVRHLADAVQPRQALALYLLAQAQAGLQDWHAALATQVRLRGSLAQLDERDVARELALACLLDEAWLRQRLHEHEQSLRRLQQALEELPEAAVASARLWHLLGLAYHGLARDEPALAALRRAEAALGSADPQARASRGPQVALALSAVLIKHRRLEEALQVIDRGARPGQPLAELDYNRGVAAQELYRRDRDAVWLLRARESFKVAAAAGSELARAAADKLAARTGASSAWFDYWFGRQAGAARRGAGAVLLLLAALVLVVAPAFAAWQAQALDWKLLSLPAVALLALLLLPGMRNLSLSWGDVKFAAEPSADVATSAASQAVEFSPVLSSEFSSDKLMVGGLALLSSGLASETGKAQFMDGFIAVWKESPMPFGGAGGFMP